MLAFHNRQYAQAASELSKAIESEKEGSAPYLELAASWKELLPDERIQGCASMARKGLQLG